MIGAWLIVMDATLSLLVLPLFFGVQASYPASYPLWVLGVRPIFLVVPALGGVAAGLGLVRGHRWGRRASQLYAGIITIAGAAAILGSVIGNIELRELAAAVCGPTVIVGSGILDVAIGGLLLWTLRGAAGR